MSNTRRLGDLFQPKHYKLHISIADDCKSFSGTVGIGGSLAQASNTLKLHSRGLKLSDITINEQAASATFDEEAQEVTLTVDESIAASEFTVQISFDGEISERMEGIYPSYYTENGEEKVIISTQFESTHAREAFPCVDEPAAKATFDVTIESPKMPVVLGNTPIEAQKENNGRLVTTFQTSPVMSTYLLAFALGDIDQLNGKTARGTEVNVFATKDNSSRLPFSLDVGIRCLEFYENYFGIDYPLPKLDMIAIPEFAAGAMENWGLVTYRETAMLFDETDSSLPTKRRVIEVIAHELAHQWFGNLVTMQWWDDLWLNESFATFMAFECSKALFPELGFDELFMETELFTALHADANSKTTSIYAELEDPRDINEHFDPAITYSKGASVLRMLHNFIGEKAFKNGLSTYLATHQYANAVGNDLWSALNGASPKPVEDFMKVWIHEPGYPVVTVTEDSLTQTRFYLNPTEREQNTDDTIWPLSVRSQQNEFYFEKRSVAFKNQNQKLNFGHYGVYRVQYPKSSVEIFAKQIEDGSLDAVDAMGLLDDMYALVRAGLVSTEQALILTNNYQGITNNAAWDVVATGVGSVSALFESDELRPLLDRYGQKLVATQYNRLGWEKTADESPFDTLLRPTIIGMASRYRLDDAVTTAGKAFDDFVKTGVQIDPNLRSIVYSTAARNGDSAIFDSLLDLHNATTIAEEKRRFAGALCGFEDEEQIKHAISLIRSDSVRIQEVISWVFGLYGNRYARDLIWEWQKQNWDWIVETFGGGHLYSYFVMGLASYSDETKAEEIEEFFKDKDLSGIKRSLEQSIEQIRTKAAWKTRDTDSVSTYLKKL